MDMINLIEQLEQLVESGTGVPATGRVLVEKDRILDLVRQLKDAIPVDIQEAQDLMKMRENLINQALQEGRKIKSIAESEAKALLSENEITKEAESQSENMVEQARIKAQKILDNTESQVSSRRAEADLYAQETLKNLEEELSQIISTIHHGIELIESQINPEVAKESQD